MFEYLEEQAKDTDIYCFQEVFDSSSEILEVDGARTHLFNELKSLLPDFQGYFAPSYSGWADEKRVDFHISEGQAIFVKNGYEAKEAGSIYIYGNQEIEILEDFTNEPKNLQYIKLAERGKEFLIANAHGKWYPGDKLDTPERLEQSKKINEFLAGHNGPKILCGDFNLMPETQSIKLLEKNLRNLIKEFRIKNTRNEISWKNFNNTQYFADYAFVSPEIKVNKFAVPYNEVSDHLPMILEFSL